MYDYLSKGGRIPAFLVLPAVEGMASDRERNWGYYKENKDNVLVGVMDKKGLPNALRGITIALYYKALKMYAQSANKDVDTKQTILDRIRAEHPIQDDRVWEVLEEAFVNTNVVTPEAPQPEERTGGAPKKT